MGDIFRHNIQGG